MENHMNYPNMNYPNMNPDDALGIGRILAQRMQARYGGPGQPLNINQPSGGGPGMVPPAEFPSDPAQQQGGNIGQGVVGLLSMLAMMKGGNKAEQQQTVPSKLG
jgi:hypothetical protein